MNDNKIKIAVIGIGCRGIGLLRYVLDMPDVEILAVCDVRDDKLDDARKEYNIRKRDMSGTLFTKDYHEALAIKEVVAVINATSWAAHVDVAIAAMEAGKDVSVEVGGTNTIENCWRLVDACERTGKQCMMLENCNYGRRELATLNMARQGIFGKIVHATGGYAHDLRSELSDNIAMGRERIFDYIHRNCENYPTHALGPIAKVLNINKGNRFVSLTSMASCAAGLEHYVDTQCPDDHPLKGQRYTQGDVVTTTIKCAHGETIVLTLDTTLPRTYSRHFGVQGTEGFYSEDGRYVYLDKDHNHDMNPLDLYGNETEYFEKYEHPIWKEDLDRQEDRVVGAGGHGSMDRYVIRAFLESVRDGHTLPIDVYDTAAWMCITVLSEESIAKGGAPVCVPDFTRGKWMLREFTPENKWSI